MEVRGRPCETCGQVNPCAVVGGVGPVPVRYRRGEPNPGTGVAGVAQSRCSCGRGEPSPGADVAGGAGGTPQLRRAGPDCEAVGYERRPGWCRRRHASQRVRGSSTWTSTRALRKPNRTTDSAAPSRSALHWPTRGARVCTGASGRPEGAAMDRDSERTGCRRRCVVCCMPHGAAGAVGHAVLHVVCHVERQVLWETLHARSDVDAPSSAASVRGHCRSRYNAIVAISSGGATFRTTRACNATCCTTSAQAQAQEATCNMQQTTYSRRGARACLGEQLGRRGERSSEE